MNNKREDWIDALKGVGIITVIIGHITIGFVHNLFFIFHMPLFFFISGYLHKSNTSLFNYLKKKALSLLVPYFIFLSLIFTYQYGFYNICNNPKYYLILYFWGGTKFSFETGIFWFVPCLFFTQQIFNILRKKLTNKLLITIGCLSLIIAYLNYILFRSLTLPWGINLVVYTLPIYTLGHFYNLYINKYLSEKPLSKLIVSIIFLSIPICYFYPSVSIDIKRTFYGIPLLSFIIGFVWIIGIIFISKKIINIRYIHTSIQYIGQASLVIMYTHQALQLWILNNVSENLFLRFLGGLLVPIFLYYLFNKLRITRILLLGKKG